MTKIIKLKQLTESESTALAKEHLAELEDVWLRIGQDINHGLDILSSKTGIPQPRLVKLLSEQAVDEARRPPTSWFGRVWLEVSLLLILAWLIGLGVIASSTSALSWLVRPDQPVALQVVSAIPQGLPAFHLIQAGEIKLVSLPVESKGFKDPASVVGRMTLQTIPSGRPIHSDQISTLPAMAIPLRVISIPVAAGQLKLATPGKPAILLLAPRGSANGLLLQGLTIEVLALGADTADGISSLTVAVPEKDLTLLTQTLGQSDVFVAAGQ